MIKFKDRFSSLKEANLPNSKDLAKRYGHKEIIKLYYNENKYKPSPKVLEALEFKSPNIYPEYKDPIITNTLSEVFNLSSDHFYVSNGSDAILDAIPTLFASRSENQNIIVPELTFGRIETTAVVNGLSVKKIELNDGLIDLDRTLAAIDDKTAIVYVVNPNMPTGKYNNLEAIMHFMDKVPSNVLVVLDEAYIEYAEGIEQAYKNDKVLIDKYDNLIITHTWSKLFALASFRIGYMMAKPYIVSLFRKAYQYLPVNKYSIQAANAVYKDLNYYSNIINITNEEKEKYYSLLDELGLKYYKSKGNFVYILVDNNQDFYEFLIKKYGVAVRAVRDNALRISIGKPEENELVFKGLREYYA